MAWFKKKTSYEQFWIELYVGYIVSGFSLGDALRVLGSDLSKLSVSVDAALSELNISKREMGHFGRIVALGSTCAAVDHFDRQEFWRFKMLIGPSEDSREIAQDFEQFGIPIDAVLNNLSVGFLSGDVSALNPWMITRSELYGDVDKMAPNIAVLFRQANVLTSFLLRHCRDHATVAFGLMDGREHEARDQVMNTVGTVFRARAEMLSSCRPV